MLKRLTTFEELDSILPLIAKLHQQNEEYYDLFTSTGYFAWLINNYPNLYILGGYNDEREATGYLIAGIQYTYGKREALVYEALCPNREIVEEGWDRVLEWAKEQGCTLLSCYSRRGSAIARKYGFNMVRDYLTKEI